MSRSEEAAGEGGGEVVVLRWSRDPRAVGRARAELRKVLAGWGRTAVEDTATLVLSELLTNSQQHARTSHGWEIETRFSRVRSDGVRLEVYDADDRLPQPRAGGDTYDCDGRGLHLVDALADRWGVTDRDGPGKCVWAECGTSRTGAPA
ncbi:ATP-binding protein [Streptomyces sp. NPDC021093]|uniref:ATP-binding protein n=1 Tax=Streptomyces sp. NPDC021093 TaxID=3365112 RepID=UPI0037BD5C44